MIGSGSGVSSLLLVLLLAGQDAVLLPCNGETPSAWQMFREQLFSNMGPDGGPQGVELLLNRMKDILELGDDTLEDGLDPDEKVDTLLDVCDVQNEDTVCQPAGLLQLNHLIDVYSFGPLPLHDYLEKCRQKRFVACRDQLFVSLRANIDQRLEPTLKSFLLEMKASIYELSAQRNRPMRFPMFPPMSTLEGILDFLERADQLPSLSGEKKFRREFKGLVMDQCEKFLGATGAPMEIMAAMLDDGWICERISEDTQTRDLLTVARMCSYLERDAKGHTKSLYKLSKERRKSIMAEQAKNQPPAPSKLAYLFNRNRNPLPDDGVAAGAGAQ